jgi:hypothetical protein
MVGRPSMIKIYFSSHHLCKLPKLKIYGLLAKIYLELGFDKLFVQPHSCKHYPPNGHY